MSVLGPFIRAARLRCPNCGGGGLRSGWIGIVTRCPSCGLRTDRGESDYFLGAYTINLLVALVLAAGLAILAAVRPSWPRVPLYAAGIAAIVFVVIAFYPFSKLLWLAFDLAFRRPRASDFDEA
jgi:uncharacterized protein (DUF983 family)